MIVSYIISHYQIWKQNGRAGRPVNRPMQVEPASPPFGEDDDRFSEKYQTRITPQVYTVYISKKTLLPFFK